MGVDIKGNLGSSPISYEVKSDSLLNISLSIGYSSGSPTDPSFSIVAGIPLAVILAAAVAQKGGVLGQAEQMLVSAAEAYLASQPA
jgi:hypothetical protein